MKKNQRSKISGLSSYNITFTKLLKSNKKIEIEVHINFPKYKLLFKYHPEVREKKLEDYFKIRFAKIERLLGDRKYEKIRVRKQIRGIKITVNSKDILLFSNKSYIDGVYIEKIEGLKKKIDKTESYFAVKAQNKILFEGLRIKNQKIEEFIYLVKAKNHEDAERKVIKEYKLYEEPYLNTDNIMVLWKLEKILDIYEVGYLDEYALRNDGVEVYSIFKKKRLKKDYVWKPIKRYVYN